MRHLGSGLRIALSCTVLLLCGPSHGLTVQRTDELAIQRYSLEAKEALARKDLTAAIPALEKLAQLTPRLAEVHGNLGMAYYAQGQYRQAAEAFERALGLNLKIPNAKVMLAICYRQIGRVKEAVPILEPAFRHPPDMEMGRVIGWQLQRAYVALGEAGKAVEVTEEMLRRYPDDPEVLYDACHVLGGRVVEVMTRLIQVAPNSPWRGLAVGEYHEAQMRYDLAIGEYRRAIQKDPRIPGVHFRLGRALLHGGEDEKTREEALEAFRQEVAIDPENSDAWYEIGEIHRKRGRPEQALEYFRKAVEYHPEFEDAQIALARTLVDLKRPQEALPHLEAAVQLNPANEVSHFLLARLYRALGDSANYQKEMALYEKYRLRPFTAKASRESQPHPTLTAPSVTKQTVEPDSPDGP